MEGIHQLQVKLVVQINEGGGGLPGPARLVILVLQQQMAFLKKVMKLHDGPEK